MPPRRSNARRSPAVSRPRPTRRSARSQKNRSTVIRDSSEDELSMQGVTAPQRNVNPASQDIQDEIVAVPSDKATNDTDGHIADAITVSTSNKDNEAGQNSHNGVGGADSNIQASSTDTPMKMSDFQQQPVGNEEDELVSNRPAVKKTKVILKKSRSVGSKKVRSKWDDPEEMLTNPDAPLATAKLRNLLCSSRAWDILTLEEKQQVLAKFPDKQEILDAGTENARPDFAALRNNNNFRHDIARYQEDLAQGRHDPEWIRQALEAHRKRELGLYDEFLARRFVQDWGMEMPDLSSPPQGQGQKNHSSDGRRSSNSKVSGSAVGDLESDEVTAAKAKQDCGRGVEEKEVQVQEQEQEKEPEQEKGNSQESMDQDHGPAPAPLDEAVSSIQVQLGHPATEVAADDTNNNNNTTTTTINQGSSVSSSSSSGSTASTIPSA